jgi:parvulin-like peptidyl-prolyl isomerase
MTLPELRVNLRDSLVLSKLKKNVFDGTSATPEEVSSVYAANKQALLRPESVKARNIFIKAATGATPEQESASKARISAAMEEARKGGDFAAVARKYSEAGNAAQGGDMGTVTRDTPLMPQMIRTLFATPPGQVSDPFRTEIGWHLVKVEEKLPPHQLTVEEAREPITRSIRLQKTEREMAALAARLWREGKVTSKLAVTPEPPGAGGAPARPSR